LLRLGLLWKHGHRPAEHKDFTSLACLLATHFIMEASGAVTKERERALLEFSGLEATKLDELAEGLEWSRRSRGNTREYLEATATGPKGKWANLHGVRILEAALVFAAQEHGGQVPDKLQPALAKLGTWLRFGKLEVAAICEAVMERILEEQGKGE
jgi:hypothetical protein